MANMKTRPLRITQELFLERARKIHGDAYDSISGYIGEKPSFFNAATDFYISEPSASRVTYQLEAGMVSIDKNNNITNALTYPDLINGLELQ